MATSRAYVAGAFGLEVDGAPCGFVVGVEGGGVHGDVVTEPPGADGVAHKHIAGIGYDEITVTCAVAPGPLTSWVAEFLTGSAPQHDGAIVFLDHNYLQLRRMEWRRATLSAVTFPALDAASKDLARLTLTIRPESTRVSPATGKSAQLPTATKEKAWLASSFRVEIPGVDCSKVTSVAALTVTQGGSDEGVGAVREPGRHAAPLKVGDLEVTVSEVGVAGFESWRDDFLVNGNNTADREKSAAVVALAPDLKGELFRVALEGVGIHHLQPEGRVANLQTVVRHTASMYCERVALVLPQQAVPEPPAVAPPADAVAPATTGRDTGTQDTGTRDTGTRDTEPTPADVARRLLATRGTDPTAAGPDLRFEQGVRLGAAWAQQAAALDELTEMAALSRTDWSVVSLPEGHSLLEWVKRAEVVPAGHEGGLDLVREPLVSGLVSGAADAYAKVRDHLAAPTP